MYVKTVNTGYCNEYLRDDFIETVTVHGSSATNTGGPYLSTRRAMHIARAKAARTATKVGTHVGVALMLRRMRVSTCGAVRAAFARAMCIARRALR